MNFDAFINKWNGKQVTAYSGECVALVAQYCVENGKPIAYANAKDWWNHPALTGAFTFETNRPTDYNQVPLRGDIIIWDGGLAGSGGYGHIAIYDAKVSPGIFRSFDQNWGGRQAHFVTHNYNNVIGWMRPKVASPPQGGDMPLTPQQENEVYQILFERPMEHGGSGRTGYQVVKDGKAELDARRQAIKDQLINIQNQANIQNETITKLSADLSISKTEANKLIGQIADANAEIQRSHDTIKDLQNNPDTQLLDNTGTWLTKLFNRLFKKG